MDKYYKWKVLLLIGVIVFSIWQAYPPKEKINLGLDLQGGMQLLLEVEVDKVPKEMRSDATDRVVEIIRNRIDEFGVREPVISKQGNNQVVVQLPGVTDRDRAIEIAAKTAHLEFLLVSDDPNLMTQAEAGNVPKGYVLKEMKTQMGMDKLLLHTDALLTGDHLTNASVGFDQYGQAIVQLQFDKEGAKLFDKATSQNIGKRLAIVLDGNVHSAPVIRDRIPNGQAQISGNFSANEASDLALVLRAGALPAPVHVIEERTVGPSLGKDSIDKSLWACAIGTGLVVLFMPVYYLLAGWVAILGLLVYIVFVVGTMAAVHASLTLPGIAGFILSIGMAVDANVLIFERMREEHETGKSARASVSAGYHKAFSAILDSNVTTLLTAVLLFMFGTGPVKGFAVTLSIGIIASMFSAIIVTRMIFDAILKNHPNINLKMLKWIGHTHIHFLKGRFWAYGFSVLTIAIGISAFAVRGTSNFGVEFTGGTLVQVQFQNKVDVSHLRAQLEKAGVKSPVIQIYGEASQNQFVIKTTENDTKKIDKVGNDLAQNKGFSILKVDQVGPTVGKDLARKAFLAILWSFIGIGIYLAWRFEWKFAIASVIMLVHDVCFSFGIYALLGKEINLPTIAALLTIMGYSVNDTIITFDRVRENMKIMRKTSYSDIVDLSVNQTLSRTVITNLTVLFCVIALLVFGGSSIKDFAFILLIGFTVGVYSTIFVGSAIAVDLTPKPKTR